MADVVLLVRSVVAVEGEAVYDVAVDVVERGSLFRGVLDGYGN